MAKNYKLLTESIKGQLNPENFVLRKSFSDELATISYSDVLTYIRFAMKGVESEYTQKSMEAGEWIKKHLASLSNVTFKYQGSVMTNTHIEGYSDIDLLIICDKFYNWDKKGIDDILNSCTEKTKYQSFQISKLENAVQAFFPYVGTPLDDLKKIRLYSENILRDIYSQFDASNGKAIKIKNLLKRNVDIVTASWYDNVSSIINDKGDYRGIQVYDKNKHERCPVDYPFLSIKRINERGNETNGRLKKMIRFLKKSKVCSEQNIDLSSFDINAICYDIDVSEYKTLSFYELVPILYNQMKSICTNQVKADSIVSVDGKECIFRNKPTKLSNLRILLAEVEGIFVDLKNAIRI